MAHGNKASKDFADNPFDQEGTSSSTGYTGSVNAPQVMKRKDWDLDEIMTRCKKDEAAWEARNRRFLRHHQLVYEIRPNVTETTRKRGAVKIDLGDIPILARKLCGMHARRGYRIEVPAQTEELVPTAQRIENALRAWDQKTNRRRVAGVHNPMAYDIAQSLFVYGWLCERQMIDHDNPMLVKSTLFNPYFIYPRLAGDEVRRVSHVFKSTIGELRDTFELSSKAFKDREDDEELTCYAYYENKEPYYHGVIADGEWVKKPTALDYWAWTIAVAQGTISHTPIGDRLTSNDHNQYIGMGFFDVVEQLAGAINLYVTMLANTLMKQENPPAVVTVADGKAVELNLSAGGTTYLVPSSQLQLLEVGPKAATLMPLLTTLQDRLNKGSLPSTLFGEGASANSGYQSALLMGAGEDTLWSFVDASTEFMALRYERFLEIYKAHGAEPIKLTSRLTQGQYVGRQIMGEQLTVEDVRANGTYVEVLPGEVAPQDKVAMGSLAVQLLNAGVISKYTARTDYTNVNDPEIEKQRIYNEAREEKELMQELRPPAPPQPQMQGPMPPEIGATGMPSNVLPPEQAGMPEQVPNDQMLVDQMMQQMLAAQGGQ